MRLTGEDAVLQRKKILEAAFDVFTSVGYAATKMEMISKKANISRSPLYYHFENKQVLFTQVCKDYFEYYLRHMDELAEKYPTQNIYQRLYRLLMESRNLYLVKGNMLSSQIMQGGEEMAELRKLNDEYWHTLRAKDMDALISAQQRGEIRADADLAPLHDYYYTVYHGLRALKLQEEFADPVKFEAVCHKAVEMVENLYAPDGWERNHFSD